MARVESLLSARLFFKPQLVGERLYFISNLSGHLSLYGMDYSGSIPEPLLPPQIALQNPHLIGGNSYYVFPKVDRILVMIDRDGDENYQPMLIPLNGGFPEPAFDNYFVNYRVHMGDCDINQNVVYLAAESRSEPMNETYQGNLETGSLVKMGASRWGADPAGNNSQHTTAIIADGYTAGDIVLYLWTAGGGERRLLYGIPLEERTEGQVVPPNGISSLRFTSDDRGLLLRNALFSDTYSLGYLELPGEGRETALPAKVLGGDAIKPVTITGTQHLGIGEMDRLEALGNNRYLVGYNIDGCSWLYEGIFDQDKLQMELTHTLVGQGELSSGVLESIYFDEDGDRFSLSFSTATSPTQIYTVEGKDRTIIKCHTRERILGVPEEWFSPGEDASFTSFDGVRISARLYLPAEELGFKGPRPLVYYVHGGPQSQERPDFAWFSMPLIQFLTLNGFAVFVPNVRGSMGYGLSYMKQVDHDWGGQDRLDHVHAMQTILPKDKRLDIGRAGVVGRSYGGYMSLTLASRHPQLWSAAVDMFGPYDLLTFMERIPETWKPYYSIVLGDPQKDYDFLVDRSPRTHIDNISCPLLVIQGKNDPRVVERESHDLIDRLRSMGKQVEYLMFENEGHDVLKFENRVACYNAITELFKKCLRP